MSYNNFSFGKKRKKSDPLTASELEEMKKDFFENGGKIKKYPKYLRTDFAARAEAEKAKENE